MSGSIGDFVSIFVSLSASSSPTRQGFGTPNLVAYFDPTTHWQGSYDLIRFYPSASVLTDLVADGFATDEPVYRAFEVAAAQGNCPPQFALSRRSHAFTQILNLTLTSIAAGDQYAVTVEGPDGISNAFALVSTGVPATDAATLAAEIAALSPAGAAATLTYSNGVITLTGGAGFSPANVGEEFVVPGGAATPGNNGTFIIASYISSSSITYANPAGATDANNGSIGWYVGANIGVVTHSGPTITITQTAGLLNDLQNWSKFLTVLDYTGTSTSLGTNLAADLTAIQAANTIGWYGLALDSNSQVEILAAQAFTEATGVGGKFGFYNNSDTICTTSSTADVFSNMQTLSYKKEFCLYSGRKLMSYGGLAMASLILAKFVGSYALSYKELAGVPADSDQTLTETQRQAINTASTSSPGTGGKNGNWYATVSGLNVAWPGSSAAGQWCDVTIFMDWLQANMQADVFAQLASGDKTPLTDFGIQAVVLTIRTRLNIGASPPYNGIDAKRPITVLYPAAADMSQQDRNNRNLSGISATAFLTGAINTVSGVQIVLTQ